MNKQTTTLLKSLALAALLAASLSAYAVDGQKLIDMARVATGGLTPGDTPGFPVTISQPGSYKLSGNLTVPNATTTAVVIAASHVTLDLNGFAILGSTDCSATIDPCIGDGVGDGIVTANFLAGTPQFNITIRNGTIQGMGRAGIILLGDSHLVEYMHVRSNGGSAIFITTISADQGSSIAQYNTVQRNRGSALRVSNGSVSHNVADTNGNGIQVDIGTVSYNVITRTLSTGLSLDNTVSYFGNMMDGNNPGGFNVAERDVIGGVNMGQNLCSGVVCPGAKF